MIYKQKNFIDGMDLISKQSDISENGYRWGFNVRSRYGYLEGCNKSMDITYNLFGKFQGLYAFGNIWVAFYSGKAYYMLVGDTVWTQVAFLQLDQTTDIIYTQAVPDSTSVLQRLAITDSSGKVNATAGIIKNNAFVITGTPSGLVCQDGINQPWIIEYNPTINAAIGRRLQTYDQWTNDNTIANGQEYVPIGTIMMYLNGILYVVNNNVIYRSVSGRPLDFMVNIDQNGNKLSTEDLGGAQTVGFAADFQTITALQPSTSEATSFIIGTQRYVYGYQPDFTNTLFGEPSFTKAFQVEAGVVNNFSITDSNGDTPFIDFEGVKFFNAVQQLKFEGNNDPLSKQISKVLINIKQDICAAHVFDNYNFFALNTIYGYLTAVFDNMSKKWVSFDITNATAYGIIMFAEATTQAGRFLAAGNRQNKIWLLYSDVDNRESGELHMRGFISGEYSAYGTFVPNPLRVEHKLNNIKVQVEQGKINSNLFVREQVDEERGQTLQQTVKGVIDGINYPVRPPVIPDNNSRIRNLVYTINQGATGFMIHPILTWDGDILIQTIDIDASEIKGQQSQKQQQTVTFGDLA